MRPVSIIWFERLFLASIVLGLANSILVWEESMATITADPVLASLGATFLIVTMAISEGINLLLWYFIARRAANVAKWILVVLTLVSLAGTAMLLATATYPTGLEGVVTTIVLGLYLVSVGMLFRSDAREWFERKGRMLDPDIFS
jgi:hypothetical protein